MDKGKIIFLCGLTSAGKTSIVDAIQNASDQFFYVVANDLMVQMVATNIWRRITRNMRARPSITCITWRSCCRISAKTY